MRKDSEIEQQVLRSLQLDSTISTREICIESHRGVVTLSGTVPSYRESRAIYAATSRAPGVCHAVNRIKVKDGKLLFPKDSWIAAGSAQKVTSNLTLHPDITPSQTFKSLLR